MLIVKLWLVGPSRTLFFVFLDEECDRTGRSRLKKGKREESVQFEGITHPPSSSLVPSLLDHLPARTRITRKRADLFASSVLLLLLLFVLIYGSTPLQGVIHSFMCS